MRAFSATEIIQNATAANARLGWMAKALCARVATMMGSSVDWEIRLAVKNTMSSAGSARKDTSISLRAPRVPNGVPMSMAASARNTRASAKMPTRAMTSAAGEKDRSLAMVGTMPAASAMQANFM